MAIKDFLSLTPGDVSNLSLKDLRKASNSLNSAANKRIKRLETIQGVESPALRRVKESGGKFSSKGKGVNELRAEFKRAREFLRSKTSTITGYREFEKNVKGEFGELSDEDFKKIMEIYRRAESLFPVLVKNYGSSQSVNEIQQLVADLDSSTVDEIISEVEKKLKGVYINEPEEDNFYSFSMDKKE